MEDSELLVSSCTRSERTSFHHWLFVLGFDFIVVIPRGEKKYLCQLMWALMCGKS